MEKYLQEKKSMCTKRDNRPQAASSTSSSTHFAVPCGIKKKSINRISSEAQIPRLVPELCPFSLCMVSTEEP